MEATRNFIGYFVAVVGLAAMSVAFGAMFVGKDLAVVGGFGLIIAVIGAVILDN